MSTPSLPGAGPDSAQVRRQLVTALELELIGPTQRVLRALGAEAEGLETEALDRLPSSWYPTGFLVPTETDLSLKCDDTADDDFAAADGVDLRKPHKANTDYKPGSGDDGGSSESGPAKPQLFPSSIGVSVLLPPGGDLKLVARWGDYVRLADSASPEAAASVAADEGAGREPQIWQRQPREAQLDLSHGLITGTRGLGDLDWPGSDGLHLRWHCRPAPTSQGYATGTVAVTLFLTNERKKAQTLVERDQRSAFQAELELHCLQGFVARLDPHAGRAGSDWDEAVNALQFRNAHEYGVGHNVGVEADFESESSSSCSCLRTTWTPQATVEKVVPRADVDCELAMEELDRLAGQGFEAIRGALMPLVEGYVEWIEKQAAVAGLNAQQQATAEQLLANARGQAQRIARGIEALAEPDIRDAFAIANRTMAAAARQRYGVMQGLKAHEFDWPGEAYLMLHSLAHLLITTSALECGYGASAIKERIYSFPGQGYGILLYTSGSGSEGTLGGLVSLADRIDQLVAAALERGRLCSNDPFCSMHDPENDLEKRYSHGAACHGCLLIAETSCEQRNQFLDRAFVVPTLDVADAAFFPAELP